MKEGREPGKQQGKDCEFKHEHNFEILRVGSNAQERGHR